ncbi:hypothetical protein EV286_102559 [Rhizobium sp. BK251]|nr:hypothetical protein EV286_102559 [Rhizobium sp. BK251]
MESESCLNGKTKEMSALRNASSGVATFRGVIAAFRSVFT